MKNRQGRDQARAARGLGQGGSRGFRQGARASRRRDTLDRRHRSGSGNGGRESQNRSRILPACPRCSTDGSRRCIRRFTAESSRGAATRAISAQMQQHGIEPIDLVVVNFYPFEKTVAKPDVSLTTRSKISTSADPTLVRAAAKNHDDVAVVVDPADYAAIARNSTRTRARLPRRRDGGWRARPSRG